MHPRSQPFCYSVSGDLIFFSFFLYFFEVRLHSQICRSKDKFTIGGVDQKVVLNVTVDNRGEDAYESQFFITIPPEFEYGGIVNYDGKVTANERFIF